MVGLNFRRGLRTLSQTGTAPAYVGEGFMIFQFPSNVFEGLFLDKFHYSCRRLTDFFTRDKAFAWKL